MALSRPASVGRRGVLLTGPCLRSLSACQGKGEGACLKAQCVGPYVLCNSPEQESPPLDLHVSYA